MSFWLVAPDHAIRTQEARQRAEKSLHERYMAEVLRGLAQNPAVISSSNPTPEDLTNMKKLALRIVNEMIKG